MNYTYIVECGDGSLYTGWTNNLEKRIRRLIMREKARNIRRASAGETGVFGNICYEGRGNEPGVCD